MRTHTHAHAHTHTHTHTHTHLALLALDVHLSLHSGEADVELLDDGRVQAVEIQQQHKLIVETCTKNKTKKSHRRK